VIGVRAMGTRFNVLMTVQVPLKQKPRPDRYRSCQPTWGGADRADSLECDSLDLCMAYNDSQLENISAQLESLQHCSAEISSSIDSMLQRSASLDHLVKQAGDLSCAAAAFSQAPPPPSSSFFSRRRAAVKRPEKKKKKQKGVANAARVSRGSEVDVWGGLRVRSPERHPSEHITVTVVVFNTVAGGVPSAADVEAAIDDMEALYASCAAGSGRLAQPRFDFMKKPLTVADCAAIANKIHSQPYAPPPTAVAAAGTFPTDGVSSGAPCDGPNGGAGARASPLAAAIPA